jgi:hypothetical protein
MTREPPHQGRGWTLYRRWDPRIGVFRAMALHYTEGLEYLDCSHFLIGNRSQTVF